MKILNFDSLTMRYEPYPIGIVPSGISKEDYEEMVRGWPDKSLFTLMPKLGNKLSLSERNNGDVFQGFVKKSAIWSRFSREIKSKDFIEFVLDTFINHGVDIGQHNFSISPSKLNFAQKFSRKVHSIHRVVRGLPPLRNLRTRFEFSMMPYQGGHLKPHTDSPGKLITLVASILDSPPQDQSSGGGTAILKAKDPKKSFNYMNQQLEFSEVEVIESIEQKPQQVLAFVKTFNSLHAVFPMTGSAGFRKSLTVNIEEDK